MVASKILSMVLCLLTRRIKKNNSQYFKKIRTHLHSMIQTISVGDVDINNYDVLIDVRTPEEFSTGHIENALLIDIKDKAFKKEIEKLDKTKSYLLICRSGGRSGQACEIMQDLGFLDVTNLEGGMLDWIEQGFEVE